ncbi:MAG: DUF1028 domain-containing protein [Rhodothermia bacterium]|nr:DUF1028 domain-containing protein [Rhodothermia bacterium]
MTRIFACALALLLAIANTTSLPALGQDAQAPNPSTDLSHTYSIVARDAATGQLGVAVQTHWFAVGRRVPWARAGVGAVATQSFTNPSYGPRGLAMLESGMTAQETLDSLVATDDGRDLRQAAVIGANGDVAAWTGPRCIQHAGHLTGDNFSVQANMMLSDRVWPAMAYAFEESRGPLAERLLLALEAGEAAGGDIRGKQSAALIVVDAERASGPWAGRVVDLRVDDSPTPLDELRRLLRVHRAYEHMNVGDEALENDEIETALREYGRAAELNPENPEMRYWFAVALANKGLVDDSLPVFAEVFTEDPNWRTLTERLPSSNLLEVSEEDLKRILAASQAPIYAD